MRILAIAALAWILATGAVVAADNFDQLAEGAATARRANRIEEAVALYRQAVQVNPAWLEGWWFLGTLSYSSYHYADCEAAFRTFVKLDPNRELAWGLAGLCEFETGNYDAALAHLERSLASDGALPPEVDAGARFHYGLLLTNAGRFEQARRQLGRFAQECDSQPQVRMGIGLNALHRASLPGKVPPEGQELVSRAGAAMCEWILQGAEKAGEALGALAHDYPKAPGVHYFYGTYLTTLRPSDARAEFQRELEIDPQNAGAAAMLALSLGKAGDAADALSSAIARLETAERLDPAALQYHVALAGAYSRAGRYSDARRERLAALELATGHAD